MSNTQVHRNPNYPDDPKSSWVIVCVFIILVVIVALSCFRLGVNMGENRYSNVPAKASNVPPYNQPIPLPTVVDNTSIDNTSPEPISSSEIIQTTPNELVLFFDQNSVGAADWSKGKKIRITAPLGYVSENMFGGDRTAVIFKTNVTNFMSPDVIFWFDGSFRSQIGRLQEGQMITCVGEFLETEFGGDIKLEGVELSPQ